MFDPTKATLSEPPSMIDYNNLTPAALIGLLTGKNIAQSGQETPTSTLTSTPTQTQTPTQTPTSTPTSTPTQTPTQTPMQAPISMEEVEEVPIPSRGNGVYDIKNNQTTSKIDGKTYYHRPRSIPMPKYRNELTDKQRYLEAHNYFRKRHCAGPVVWDDKLEELARQWANELATTNYSQKGRGTIDHPSVGNEPKKYLSTDGVNVNVGQNIAYGGEGLGNGDTNFRQEIEDVVADWYEEVMIPNFQGGGMRYDGSKIIFTPSLEEKKANAQKQKQRYTSNGCSANVEYDYDKGPSCNPQSGHFTQVVWKDTKRIGCAKVPVKWENGTAMWVCNYGPAGNVMDPKGQNYKNNVISPDKC